MLVFIDLHIKAKNDVSVGYFQGDKVIIETEKNVFIDRFQGNTLDVSTQDGNIILNNFIQAANISAKVTNGVILLLICTTGCLVNRLNWGKKYWCSKSPKQ